MLVDRVLDLLKGSGVHFEVHRHDPVISIEDAHRIAPSLVPGLLKTVAFKIKDSHWVLAAVHCADRIDYRKLSDLLGVNRRLLRSLSPTEVEEQLGFQVGGVGPLSLNPGVLAVFDSGLLDAGMVYFGSGSNTLTIGLNMSDLLRITGGRAYPIRRDDLRAA